jgi:WD40 repeat protein
MMISFGTKSRLGIYKRVNDVNTLKRSNISCDWVVGGAMGRMMNGMRYLAAMSFGAVLALGCGGPEPIPVERPPRPPLSTPQALKIAGDPVSVPVVATAPAPAETNPLLVPLPFGDGGPDLPAADPGHYARWRQLARIHVGQSHLDTADVSADGRLLLARSDNEATVRIYDRKTRKLRGNFAVPGFAPGAFKAGDVTFWPDPEDPALFLVGDGEGLALFDASSGDLVARLAERPLRRLRWSADRRVLVGLTAGRDSRLVFLERGARRNLAHLATLALPHRVDGWDLSDDNRLLAAVTYPDDRLGLYDLEKGERRWSIPAPTYAAGVDISPDGRLVAVGGNHLLVVDAADPARRSRHDGFDNNINTVRFSPSGDAVAASSYDGRIRIFRADVARPELRLLKTLRHGGTANVYSLVFLDGGERLMSVSGDRTLRIWGTR